MGQQMGATSGKAAASPAPESTESRTLTTRQFFFADDAGQDAGSLTWSSDNESVATVNEEGLVKAKAVGRATIEARDGSGTLVSSAIVTVEKPAYNQSFDVMQDRWLRRIVGAASADGPIDVSDTALKAYAEKQLADAQTNWDSMHKEAGRTTLWDKIPSDSVSANYTSQLKKLRPLVIAFGMGLPGNKLYQNRDLYEDIMGALAFFVNDMNYGTEQWEGNWWDWQIGCPGRLADILIVMSDYAPADELTPIVNAVGTYCKEPSKQLHKTEGWITATGSNRTDIANAMVGMGIVSKDASWITPVDEQVPEAMEQVTSGDGIYADGSVVQHTAQAYTGSYGNELVKGIGKITSILAGTDYQISDARINNLYNAVLEGYIPLMYGPQMMSMVSGRSISRVQNAAPFSAERYWGNETIANMLLISQSASEPYKSAYASALKGWLIQAGDFYYENARDFDALLQARALVADTSVTPSKYTGMHVYGSMDRVVQQTGSYAASLSMYSSRIYNYECMNKENLHGWHTGDGMLYIYDDETGAYDEGYWPTVDPYRLPGTTVDTKPLEDGAATAKLSSEDWVGGVTDGSKGAAGLSYDASSLGVGMDLKAKKSYFFLDGMIVELGAGITGMTDASIETTIENRIMPTGDARVAVNGSMWNGSKDVALEGGDYVTLAGSNGKGGMGYYFNEGTDAELSKETRTGSYADINAIYPFATEYTRSYFKMGINHGQRVENGSYSFIVMPGATDESIKEYAANPSVTVLSNTADVQAVSDASTGEMMANFWSDAGGSVDAVGVDGPASVYTTVKDGVMTVRVSDPTQLSKAVNITIDGAGELVSKDDSVGRNADGSIRVSTKGSAGATHTFSVKVATSTPSTPLEPALPVKPSDDNKQEGGEVTEEDKTDTGKTNVSAKDSSEEGLPQTGDVNSGALLAAAAGGAVGVAMIAQGVGSRKRE